METCKTKPSLGTVSAELGNPISDNDFKFICRLCSMELGSAIHSFTQATFTKQLREAECPGSTAYTQENNHG